MRCWHGPQVAVKDVPRLFTPVFADRCPVLVQRRPQKSGLDRKHIYDLNASKREPVASLVAVPGCACRHSICQPIMSPPTFRDWVGPSWIPMGFWVWTVWLGSCGPGSLLQRRCIGQKLLWQVWHWINPLKFPSVFRVVAAGVRSCPNMFGPVVYALFRWAKLGFTHPWVALGLGTVF